MDEPSALVESRQPLLLSRKSAELLDWFRKHANPLAEAYEAALLLLHDRGFPCRLYLLAHVVRDIANRLIFALDPQEKPSMVQYAERLDKIMALWPSVDPIAKGAGDVTGENVEISYKLATKIDRLVEEHRTSRLRPTSAELLFRYLMRDEPSHADLNMRVIQDFERVRRWFVGFAHVREEPALVGEEELQRQFSAFEGMLHSFVGGFFTGTEELDAILGEANQ